MKAHSPARQHEHPKNVFEFLPGPVKIKDGLFMGDEIAARDIEFIISNKVTHIINTVSRQIPNLWERFGIHYLSVNWTQKEQNIFDKKNNAVNTVFQFIQEAMENGESCLIHSLYGKSRGSAVLVAYLMKKYSWSLDKCMEYISSKKENLQIRVNYMRQLEELEARMREKNDLSSDWKECKDQDQLVLKNTLANSKLSKIVIGAEPQEKKTKKRISFDDKPVVYKMSHSHTQTKGSHKEATHALKNAKPCKSILKGFEDPLMESKGTSEDFGEFDEQDSMIKKKESGSIINNINGGIIHVTVNNFITSDKKTEQPVKGTANTRPYSSDQKEREKEKKPIINPKKTLLNDPLAFGNSFKSPYDMKAATKTNPIKTVSKAGTGGRFSANERPQSAKHRTPSYQSSKVREELVVTNSSSNQGNSRKKVYNEDFFHRR